MPAPRQHRRPRAANLQRAGSVHAALLPRRGDSLPLQPRSVCVARTALPDTDEVAVSSREFSHRQLPPSRLQNLLRRLVEYSASGSTPGWVLSLPSSGSSGTPPPKLQVEIQTVPQWRKTESSGNTRALGGRNKWLKTAAPIVNSLFALIMSWAPGHGLKWKSQLKSCHSHTRDGWKITVPKQPFKMCGRGQLWT